MIRPRLLRHGLAASAALALTFALTVTTPGQTPKQVTQPRVEVVAPTLGRAPVTYEQQPSHYFGGGCAPGPHRRPAPWPSLGRHVRFAAITKTDLVR